MLTFLKRFFIFLLVPSLSKAQQALPDTAILTSRDLIAIVKKYHPVVKQADIAIEKTKAAIIVARGGFDPLAYLNTDQKTFDGKNYYQYTNPELKIPTWYGIEVKAGLENNQGQNLNNEITPGRTSYAGISVPLAKNLVMDSRRAALQQSKLFRQQSESEKINTLNDLLHEAYVSYWNWVKEYELYKILSNAIKVSERRLALVKTGVREGDRPAIDTVEALAQLQNFQFLQNELWVKFKNAGVELSAFLWLENNTFYQLNDSILPDSAWNAHDISSISLGVLDEILNDARLTHPKLFIFSYKIQSLEVDRKLKFQSLLPTIDLNANLLNKGYNVLKGVNAAFYENNNKFGIDFKLPLRLSEGRGLYKIAKLKISETGLALSLQKQEIENKIRYYYNELAGLQKQIGIYEQAYLNYQTLFRGEDTRFKSGESTLFLLNTRESKVLEALQKLTELKVKFYKTQVTLQWAAGQLR